MSRVSTPDISDFSQPASQDLSADSGLNMADKSTEEGKTIDDDEFCIPKPSWLIFDKLFGSVVQVWIVKGNYCRLYEQKNL